MVQPCKEESGLYVEVVPTGCPSNWHPEHGKLAKGELEDEEVDRLAGYPQLKVGVHQVKLDK